RRTVPSPVTTCHHDERSTHCGFSAMRRSWRVVQSAENPYAPKSTQAPSEANATPFHGRHTPRLAGTRRSVTSMSARYRSGSAIRIAMMCGVTYAAADELSIRTLPTSASSGYVRNPPNTPKTSTFAMAYTHETTANRMTAVTVKRPAIGQRLRNVSTVRPTHQTTTAKTTSIYEIAASERT